MSAKELNIGDYCRDEKGNIDKIIDIRETTEYAPISAGAVSFHYTEEVFEKDRIKSQIIKSSSNIIDLVQKGDYVNGMKVFEVIKNIEVDDIKEHLIVFINEIKNELFEIYGDDIKSIVTKEMYASVEYRVETN